MRWLAFLIWLVAGAPNAVGAGAYVQSAQVNAFAGTTVTASLTSVVSGHLIVGEICWNPQATINLSGVTVGGSAATLLGPFTNTIASSEQCTAYYFPNVASGSISIVATLTGTCAACLLLAEEDSGIVTSSPVDGVGNGTYTFGLSTAVPCGSFTTSTNGDFIWTGIEAGGSPVKPSGYTQGSSAASISSANVTQGSSGAINPTWTSSGTDANNYVVCAAFKVPGGAAPAAVGNLPLLGVGP